MNNFKIPINNIELNSEELFPYVKRGNVDEAIVFMKEKTNCSTEEAYEVYKELKQMVKAKPLQQWERDKYEKEYKHSTQQQNPPKPQITCPYCNSTNTKKISTVSRAGSILGFGILSKKIGKQWHCNNCGSDF